ncbi:DEAD/DEAH box helicase [Sphingomonas sp. LY160]|uniref:DEAD/DEAH box helicase n=1 Tax=Sphingomonas sp. LY160 TaxID=3095342 RepID=UPI002ADEF81D|nr:DEAD/DEAH box helicase [Sphingomonas sp. LY160]MEA1072343.1 DEAD/DEAH box helicase [Sphingomonas sp. LY160]
MSFDAGVRLFILEYLLTKFTDLGLSQPLLDALAIKNYSVPTPIQAQAIPTVLTGRDLLGIAQTGTGKTAAFMLPSLDRLANPRVHPIAKRVRMLVLAPTRELASQIAESARTYSKNVHLSVDVIFGGTAPMKSVRAVARGLDVLVATPGRLLDLVDQRAIDLSRLEILVLDEADQMLDLGFIHALKRIVQIVPKQRQTLFFSATMPKAIKQLADTYLTNPAEVSVTPAATTVDRIAQTVTHVNQAEKAALLTLMLKKGDAERTLVFSRTKHGADKIVRQLAASGIESVAIHGNKSQPQRERAMAAFKSGQAPVLIATDIAARGIDIPGVSHVVNFDLPDVPEQYVHRIGRTARAGADGIALAFCSPDERLNLRDIEKTTRLRIPVSPLPEGFVAAAAALKALKLPPSAREERGGGGGRGSPRGGERRDRDGQRFGRPAAPRAAIQPTGGQRRDDGPRSNSTPRIATGEGAPRPQRTGPGGAPKRPFNGRRGGPGGGGGGRPQRAQG